MGTRGRPKGTRERTANWYARLWFDLAMVKKNQRGRTRNLAGTVKQLQDTFPQRYGRMTPKTLREYLSRPPFHGMSVDEAAQFIVSVVSRAVLLHSIARRIVKTPPASLGEITTLATNLVTLQLQPFANEYALGESEAETLIKTTLVRDRGFEFAVAKCGFDFSVARDQIPRPLKKIQVLSAT
jgi:hypothetical protein